MANQTEGRAKLFARPALTLLFVAFAALALAVVATVADGWPLPRAFDEFSQVLAGETFAKGQLANRAHPIPHAVATIHVIHQPTYASKYLPGHGLFLALGTVLGGGPRLGQWLAFAAMAAALYWMLTGWLTRRTSLVATLLLVLVLADTDWASGYWGSSVAVTGSALVFGVVPRLRNGPAIRLGLLAGLGAVMLALTRPFEGLAVSLVPAVYIAWWLLTTAERRRRLLLVGVPCALVVTLGAALLAAHNSAVTGSPLRLAYAHYEKAAPGAPAFIWQKPNLGSGVLSTVERSSGTFQNVRLQTRSLRTNEVARIKIDLGSYTDMRRNWPRAMWSRTTSTLRYYLPHAAFALPFLLIPFALRDRRLWLAIGAAASVGAAVGASSFYLPHYVGPALPPLLILYALTYGTIARINVLGLRIGRAAVVGLALILGAHGTWKLFSHDRLEGAMTRPFYWTRQREAIANNVLAQPGKHVLFVRYGSDYKSQNEWVQNGADLSSTRVLWVHDLGNEQNAALGKLESGRTAWLVSVPGVGKPHVARYELQQYARIVATQRERGGDVMRRPETAARAARLP